MKIFLKNEKSEKNLKNLFWKYFQETLLAKTDFKLTINLNVFSVNNKDTRATSFDIALISFFNFG